MLLQLFQSTFKLAKHYYTVIGFAEKELSCTTLSALQLVDTLTLVPVGYSKYDEGGPCVFTFFWVFLECVVTEAVVEWATYGEIMSLASEAKRKTSWQLSQLSPF